MELNKLRINEKLKNTGYFFTGVFVFVVISILVLLIVYVPMAAKLVNERAEAEVRDAAYANSSAVSVWFGNKMSYLDAAASEFTKIDLEDEALVSDTCVSICGNGDFRHIGFTNTSGITFSSCGSSSNYSYRKFIQDGLSGKSSVAANMKCDFDGAAADMFSVPVTLADGTLVGVLTGDHTPFRFSDVVTLDVAGDSECFFIFDPYGDVVYCSDGNKLGLGKSDNIVSAINDTVTANDVSFMLNRKSAAALRRINVGGADYMAAFADIPGFEWTFAVIVPSDSVYSTFGTLITFTAGLILLMSVLLLISILVTSIRISRITNEVSETIEAGLDRIYTDSITGHDTIEKFRENYAMAMKNTASGHALISLDIDKFKTVNDTFGFEGGNDIIRRLSDIIKRNLGKNDFFARSSGDLFYILAEFNEKSRLIELAKNIMSDVEYQINEIKLNVSIGIYIIDDPHIRSRVAADRADLARESIKNAKDSTFIFFDNSMIEKIRREKKIEDIMEDALALGEFLVYLQPKFSLGTTNEVVGAEALVRWKHDGKIIPPGDFIPLFERNGFVTKIDYYMFEEVCKLQKKYISLGFTPKIISVNMSRLHIHKTGFVAELAAICAKYDLETKYIEIEITESAAYEDMVVLCDIFREIKSYGFHVSIDDFGTGYSSLNMLKDMPVDVIKIDRSFLTEKADENENASLVIACLVMLAGSLRIETICEGVETQVQVDLLTKLGCDMVQGFYFARPMPVPDYEKLTYGIESN
ncbi:MAG: EAL domain-containing protein [Ruminiclostridium sp.]|nr:EAL domain-containing protein [Ruminiclostridium sp.]